jgi:hypothetical protein
VPAEVRVAGRVGASAGRGSAAAVGGRRLAFAELSVGASRGVDQRSVGVSLGGNVAAGRTAGARWERVAATARLTAGSDRGAVAVDAAFASVGRAAPAFERPLVGGSVPVLFDAAVLGQRLAVPALPTGFRSGRQAAVARVSLFGPALTPFASVVGTGRRRAPVGAARRPRAPLRRPVRPVRAPPARAPRRRGRPRARRAAAPPHARVPVGHVHAVSRAPAGRRAGAVRPR